MFVFTFRSLDAFGHAKILEIEALDVYRAMDILRQEGFKADLKDVLSVRRKSLWGTLRLLLGEGLFVRVPKKDIYRFIKMLGHSLMRGKNLHNTLEFMAQNEDQLPLKKLILNLMKRMEKPFMSQTEIFEGYPYYFDEEFLGIIEAGETSSNLGQYLVDYSREKKKQEKMKAFFAQMLGKRLVTFFIVLMVALIVIVFVIPQFKGLFGDDLAMPWALLFLTKVSHFMFSYGPSFVIFCTLMILIFTYLIKTNQTVKWKWHDFLLHQPVLGHTLKTYYTAQFAYLLSTLLTKNVDIIKALQIIIKQTRNVCMAATYHHVLRLMRSGDDLFSAILWANEEGKSYMVSSIVQAAKVGAETSSLGNTLMDVRQDLAELLNVRLERSIKLISFGFYGFILLLATFLAYAIGTAILTFYNNAQNLI